MFGGLKKKKKEFRGVTISASESGEMGQRPMKGNGEKGRERELETSGYACIGCPLTGGTIE